MDGIQLSGSWGSRVSQSRLEEINKAAMDNKGFTLQASECLSDTMGLADHAGAFSALQALAKARSNLISLNRQPISDKNEHLFTAAFEKAVCAVEDVAKHVHKDYQSSFISIRNSSSDQRTPGGTIVVSDIGSKYTFECHYHPNMKGEKFTLIVS